jgi:DNA-binding MarR family transcriptional regulator
MKRDSIDGVLRSLRRVNLQGSFFGQTVAIRFGLSESDIETLEALIDMGATTAGRLAELTGLTSGAVTRVIDRLEQSGYVRRAPDPADRRRVIVEVVPEKVAAVQSTLNRVGAAGAAEIGRYTDAQLALITDFLTRMEQITRDEATSLREHPEERPAAESQSEHTAPLGGLTSARLLIRTELQASSTGRSSRARRRRSGSAMDASSSSIADSPSTGGSARRRWASTRPSRGVSTSSGVSSGSRPTSGKWRSPVSP